MPKAKKRAYSRYTLEVIELFGCIIRAERIARKWTAQELCERAGISRGLLQRIEKGDPNCTLGIVFEVAYLLSIPLYDSDEPTLTNLLDRHKEKLKLLPKYARNISRGVDDDF